MKFDDYQNIAANTDQFRNGTEQRKFFIPLMGLIGEIGSLIAEYKKCLRDGNAHEDYMENTIEDLGDALWYVAILARRYDLNLSKIAHNALLIRVPKPLPLLEPDKHKNHIETYNKEDITSFQVEAQSLQRFDVEEERNLFITLIATSKKANELIYECMKANTLNEQKAIMMVGLGSMIWQLSYIASIQNIEFLDVALNNLDKISSRWPLEPIKHTNLFDEPYPDKEQFPRLFEIAFKGVTNSHSENSTIMTFNGKQIGNSLTDNSHDDNGYRFHDAIHYAFVAILGWSPVMRALLKVKRKSNSKTDEVEDGARAIIIEEAVVGLTYDYACDHNMLYDRTDIDYSRIKIIQKLCRGLEVQECKPWEWRKAILKGYEMFRQLRDNEGGILILDLENRNIEYKENDVEN